jgi:hypothetical protein
MTDSRLAESALDDSESFCKFIAALCFSWNDPSSLDMSKKYARFPNWIVDVDI